MASHGLRSPSQLFNRGPWGHNPTEMETMTLNTAVDTRRWARTESDAVSRRPAPDRAPARSREDEQRFQQTAPGDGVEEDSESEREDDADA